MESKVRSLSLVAVAAAISGCAALVPNTITPEVQHGSELFQHQPFTSHPTNYGYEVVDVCAQWNVRHAFVAISEGYNLSPDRVRWPDGTVAARGALIGASREVFTARVGYTFVIKP